MKKLDHPNVVKLFEVLDVREDDSLFMGAWWQSRFGRSGRLELMKIERRPTLQWSSCARTGQSCR